jgi:hypothetical protein
MNRRMFFHRLLAILVIVGLLAPQLAAPAAAMLPAAAAMGGIVDMSANSDMSTMSGEMPCCPDEQKDRHCQDCPMIGMCMPAMVQAQPQSIGIPVFFATRRSFFVHDDAIADGLIGPPPDHPPRTSI